MSQPHTPQFDLISALQQAQPCVAKTNNQSYLELSAGTQSEIAALSPGHQEEPELLRQGHHQPAGP